MGYARSDVRVLKTSACVSKNGGEPYLLFKKSLWIKIWFSKLNFVNTLAPVAKLLSSTELQKRSALEIVRRAPVGTISPFCTIRFRFRAQNQKRVV